MASTVTGFLVPGGSCGARGNLPHGVFASSKERSANRKTSAETAQVLLDAMTYADEDGEEPYFRNELIWADDTPDGKQQMAVYRRDFGIRIRPARKARMRKLSYEWLAGCARRHRPLPLP